jgi:hypothetical protein
MFPDTSNAAVGTVLPMPTLLLISVGYKLFPVCVQFELPVGPVGPVAPVAPVCPVGPCEANVD